MFDSDARPSALGKLHKLKIPLWVLLAVAAVLVAVAIQRQSAVMEAQQQLTAQRQALQQQFETDRAAIEARAGETYRKELEQARLLFGSSLSWAVRSALLHRKLDEVDQYFTELVQTGGVKVAVLADAKGKIIASTDRKLQGTRFRERFPAEFLEVTNIAFRTDAGSNRLVLPIRGLTSRLGTVVISYGAP